MTTIPTIETLAEQAGARGETLGALHAPTGQYMNDTDAGKHISDLMLLYMVFLDDEDTDFAGALSRDPVDAYLIEPTTLPEGVGFLGVMTSHHDELQTTGVATINFFPNGFVEPRMIYVGEQREEGKPPRAAQSFTLMIHPLTGHTDVESGQLKLDEDFFTPEEDE